MFYAESPKLSLQTKLDKRPNRVADESGHEFYANSQVWILHYFRWTSVLLSYLYDYRVQVFFFVFFCLFDILINSQADIKKKTHETRGLWMLRGAGCSALRLNEIPFFLYILLHQPARILSRRTLYTQILAQVLQYESLQILM